MGSGKLSCGLKKSEILLGNPGRDWIYRTISFCDKQDQWFSKLLEDLFGFSQNYDF